MVIRTLRPGEDQALLDLLDNWELGDGWRGRDLFRRYLDCDPAFEPRNVWVAVEDGDLVSSVQIFPRRLRVAGKEVPIGGIGSVFTRADRRRSGLASRLLEAAVTAMERRGMEVSLLFATRLLWYRDRGWEPWQSRQSWLERLPRNSSQGSITAESFDRERDLAQVRTLHHHYCAPLDGTVVRDEAQWWGSLALAGNPHEEFLVARRGGEVVAYLRAVVLEGRLTLTEWGRKRGAAEPLASLVERVLSLAKADPWAPGRMLSQDLRRRALVPSLCDDELAQALALRGITLRHGNVPIPVPMLRCLNPEALAGRLEIHQKPQESPERYLGRVLPRERFFYWPADRF